MSKPYSIHWFRRDLRIAGNPGLQKSFAKFEGRVLGLFFFDSNFLTRSDFSHHRFQFFLETMKVLKADLQKLGGDLLVLDHPPVEGFKRVLQQLSVKPGWVSWNRDYEPFAVRRDRSVQEFLQTQGLEVHTERDHLLIEPQELAKGGDPSDPSSGYQVYSPFARKWREIFVTPEVQSRVQQQLKGLQFLKNPPTEKIFKMCWKDIADERLLAGDSLDRFLSQNLKNVTIEIPKAGSAAAMAILDQFREGLAHYKDRRDLPAVNGTSGISIFLKNGSLTIAQVIAALNLKSFGRTAETSQDKYLAELIWREFYYHILARHPRVETEAFLLKYKDLKWENNQDWFRRWTEGMTGFPIVDAGMRQLRQTGWMHNRVRMIVASFLTKDLLIDWKWGENHFMKYLLDGDLAPNNGGWQWAASTGCDPQPYFRIFNPWKQGEKFDPDGIYIKKYIPELGPVPTKDLHRPHQGFGKYPAPMVDHSIQSKKALTLYKTL